MKWVIEIQTEFLGNASPMIRVPVSQFKKRVLRGMTKSTPNKEYTDGYLVVAGSTLIFSLVNN